MTPNLSYRPGTVADLNQLKELGKASYGQYEKCLSAEHWETLNNFLNNEETLSDLIVRSKSFVCLDGDLIVGMAYLLLSGNPTDIYQQDWSYIRMVGVHPLYSGRGIATELTQMCINKAKELNEKTVALHTSEFMPAARHIYESLGFRILKEIPPRLGKKYWLYKLDIL